MPVTKSDVSKIRNKIKREDQALKLKRASGKERLKRRIAKREAAKRGEEVEKGHTRTIENTAEWLGDVEGDNRMKPAHVEVNEETGNVQVDLGSLNDLFPQDETDRGFSDQKVFMTTSPGKPASPLTKEFLEQLQSLLGGKKRVDVIPRRTPKYPLRKVAKWVRDRNYGSLIVVHEDHKKPNYLTICHLPVGPTIHFRLTGIVPSKDIYGHGRPTAHAPELVLNKFQTPLGLSVATMLSRLFLPPRIQEQLNKEQFIGRQVVLAQNSRDYIFIRRYRYMFDRRTESALVKPIGKTDWEHDDDFLRTRLQEIGPRFTLKLRWIRRGIIAQRSEDGGQIGAASWSHNEMHQDDDHEGGFNELEENKFNPVEGNDGDEFQDSHSESPSMSSSSDQEPEESFRRSKAVSSVASTSASTAASPTASAPIPVPAPGQTRESNPRPKLSRKEKRALYRAYKQSRPLSPDAEPEVAPVGHTNESSAIESVGKTWHIGRGAGGNEDLKNREWQWDPKMGVSRRQFFL